MILKKKKTVGELIGFKTYIKLKNSKSLESREPGTMDEDPMYMRNIFLILSVTILQPGYTQINYF